MKKVLSVCLIACVMILALMGALTALPHVHGSDTNHSTHQTCPVYQLSLHSVDMMAFATMSLFLVFHFEFIRQKKSLSSYRFCFTSLSSRAPPFTF